MQSIYPRVYVRQKWGRSQGRWGLDLAPRDDAGKRAPLRLELWTCASSAWRRSFGEVAGFLAAVGVFVAEFIQPMLDEVLELVHLIVAEVLGNLG